MRLMLRHSEVAIDIVIFCARNSGTKVKTVDAARFAGTTEDFARQVVVLLRRLGLIVTVRGPSGGIALAPGVEKARIGMILRMIDPSSSRGIVPARRPLELLTVDAQEAAYRTFDRYTVGELAQDVASGRLACLDCALRTHARSPRSPRDVPVGASYGRVPRGRASGGVRS